MREAAPTEDEQEFFRLLSARIDEIQDWYHQDADGTLWMTASYDYVRDGGIVRTLRIDYDGSHLVGGWSPSSLNWDDGVRAGDAQIDTTPPEGIDCSVTSPEDAAAIAADWFKTHPGPR